MLSRLLYLFFVIYILFNCILLSHCSKFDSAIERCCTSHQKPCCKKGVRYLSEPLFCESAEESERIVSCLLKEEKRNSSQELECCEEVFGGHNSRDSEKKCVKECRRNVLTPAMTPELLFGANQLCQLNTTLHKCHQQCVEQKKFNNTFTFHDTDHCEYKDRAHEDNLQFVDLDK